MQEKLSFAKRHWQLFVIFLFIASQFVLVFGGYFVIKIYGIDVYITIPAMVMLIYKLWQKRLSYPHVRGKMKESRRPIVEEIKTEYPALTKDLDNELKKFTLIPTFRNNVKKLGVSEADWKRFVNKTFKDYQPLTSIVVPIYDIDHAILRMQVDSMAAQYYDRIHYIYLGVNDKKDQATVDALKKHIAENYSGLHIKFDVFIEPTAGKRHVQNAMFNKARKDGCEIVIHMDGDGFADPNAVDRLVWEMVNDLKAGIVTGYVEALNKTENMQTRVIFVRYSNAFLDERGATSAYGENYVPSGPNFAIWTWLLDLIQELWYSDEFMEIEMTFGDDRATGFFLQFLTLIIAPNPRKAAEELKEKDNFWLGINQEALDKLIDKIEEQDLDLTGLKSIFTPESIVYTDVPTTIEEYDPQQIRWNTSAWIYNIRSYLIGIWAKLSFFTRMSIAYLTFYPFVVMSSLFVVLISIIEAIYLQQYGIAFRIFSYYSAAIILVHWIFFSVTGFWLTGDLTYFVSPMHFYYWVRVQLKARFVSLIQIRIRDWRTRKKRGKVEEAPDELASEN